MSPIQERLKCTCIGAGCGAISGALFTFAMFPYDICFTMSFAGFSGLVAGGGCGACTTNRHRAALFGAIGGAVIGPVTIYAVLHLIVKLFGVGP